MQRYRPFCSTPQRWCTECVLSVECVLCRMCSLQNVFSTECVHAEIPTILQYSISKLVCRMCSPQNVFSTEYSGGNADHFAVLLEVDVPVVVIVVSRHDLWCHMIWILQCIYYYVYICIYTHYYVYICIYTHSNIYMVIFISYGIKGRGGLRR